MDTVGVLTGGVADAAALLSALIDGLVTRIDLGSITDARLGWVSPESLHPTQTSIIRSARDLVDPYVTDELDLLGADELLFSYRVIQGREAHVIHAERLKWAPELYDPEVRDRLEKGGAYTNAQLSQAIAIRTRLRAHVAQLLVKVDFIALPSIPFSAPLLSTRRTKVDDREVDISTGLLSLTAPWSLVGLPAVSIPAGDVDGLPVALQIVGRANAEADLLSFAAQLESQRLVGS
jgi:aspartyl-tRNA(Asn)/glutamyl-tRNA(Gln) amidotransferase subunit A